MTPSERNLFQVNERLTLVPVVHGSLDYALHVRRIVLSEAWDCISIPLPEAFQHAVEQTVQQLPRIHVVAREETDSRWGYVPVDPCQPVIMAIRLACQEYIPLHFHDDDSPPKRSLPMPMPDPFSVRTLSLERFCAALIPAIPPPAPDGGTMQRIARIATRIQRESRNRSRTLALCDIRLWPWVREACPSEQSPPEESTSYKPVHTYPVKESSLVFVLGETPYTTYQFEKARQELLPEEDCSVDSVKQLLLDTRRHWLQTQKPLHNWATPQRLRLLLQYIRNLCLLNSRLTPDLYTMTMAAKQVLGDTFAISLIETAKEYPYQHDEPHMATFGIDQVRFPDGGGGTAFNWLEGQPRHWRKLELKKQPDATHQKEWKQKWNPYGICSYPPEDERIESLNTHVREVARSLMGAGLARSEKFSTSLKDGLDIRESIRHWYSGDLYVQEFPPARGSVDAVVFLFDSPADHETYSWYTTWYAEHDEESTLSFFATPMNKTLIGPGIAQCKYGGCLFLYPPQMVPDIWVDPRLRGWINLEERLLAGACLHARQKTIVVVSGQPLRLEWKQIARGFRKKLLHIPISRFSTSLLDRLRFFHVLNGKSVRSYASRFIRSV